MPNFGAIGVGDDFDTLVQAVPGVGFDGFAAYDAAGGLAIVGATTVGLTDEFVPSGAGYTMSGGEVTAVNAGTYAIDWMVSIDGAASARTHVECWIEVDGVEVPGTRGNIYARMANYGSGAGGGIFLALTAGSVVRMRAQRVFGSGAVTTMANGSRLRLDKKD